ncbi:PP2C family serine/threonine-protein phosphatase [Mycoplasma sp. Ms02]|uniref:PP2C family protein-serine/threonine phosphatase n=1 Tax=Mycoplasma sp. Ms02 TaxID=353851 RepID=UPI001C8AC59F|nr:protein phosphatase 2C domain-containing protein [Mycoplasma sp. Ms02]QZE12634.1 protein phosphatase 2C domain-containing protein [Mycoplasma sp. Ms02]
MMTFKTATKSIKGHIRSINQDRVAFGDYYDLFFALICDGVGGEEGGEIAAQIVADAFERRFTEMVIDERTMDITDVVVETVDDLKKAMAIIGEGMVYSKMATTFTSFYWSQKNEDKFMFFHCGDTRAYLVFEDGTIKQITEDHTVASWAKNNNVDVSGVKNSTGKLTNAISAQNKKINVDILELDTKPLFEKGLRYIMLTSDGIHSFLTNEDFKSILIDQKGTPRQKSIKLTQMSEHERNSTDNQSVVLIEVKNA